MSIPITFRPLPSPLDVWAPADARRSRSPFDSPYTRTLQVLRREVEHLSGTDLVLQVVAPQTAARLDGGLRADAKVHHPGVSVTFASRDLGTLVYECDRYTGAGTGRPSWEHNLRAIALGLEALRKVERYGIAKRGQQYAGFAALNAAPAVSDAVAIIARAAGVEVFDPGDGGALAAAIRAALRATHPDQNPGIDPGLFVAVHDAASMLKAAS